MITLGNLTGPWYAWVLVCLPGVAAIGFLTWWRRRDRPEWCKDCEEWCDSGRLCDCCYADERRRRRQAAEPRPPMAPGMRAWLRDHLRRQDAAIAAGPPVVDTMAFALALPVVYDAAKSMLLPGPFELELERELDDDWPTELERINAERRAGLLPELDADYMTDDPDVLEWDARAQAARAWEIVNVQFPALRADTARQYAAAAAACHDYWKAAAA